MQTLELWVVMNPEPAAANPMSHKTPNSSTCRPLQWGQDRDKTIRDDNEPSESRPADCADKKCDENSLLHDTGQKGTWNKSVLISFREKRAGPTAQVGMKKERRDTHRHTGSGSAPHESQTPTFVADATENDTSIVPSRNRGNGPPVTLLPLPK